MLAAHRNARGQANAPPFGDDLGAIASVAGAGGANITRQPTLDRTAPLDAVIQYLDADPHVGNGVQGSHGALADSLEFIFMHASNDLHQALRANMTFRVGVVAGLEDRKSDVEGKRVGVGV